MFRYSDDIIFFAYLDILLTFTAWVLKIDCCSFEFVIVAVYGRFAEWELTLFQKLFVFSSRSLIACF